MKGSKILWLCLIMTIDGMTGRAADTWQAGQRRTLAEGWQLKSSALVLEDGSRVSAVDYQPQEWLKISMPSTVLSALVKNGVYPDPRIGLNTFRIPDASDEFNRKHDLAKHSYLPDKRNPWKDPYWYRTEFRLPESAEGRHLGLNFKGINYRADVWLNGCKVADHKEMVGVYRRFRFDITEQARPGRNCLAVKVYPVDHPGEPDTQLKPLGPSRTYFKKEIQKDVAYTVAVGYDCMPSIPDRNMGIWQDVYLDSTGEVEIRDLLVVPHLPLPNLSPASLTISADLLNLTRSPQQGVCRGVVREAGVEFSKPVQLGPGETRHVVFSTAEFPQLTLANPRLWWPKNYGPQNLYHLRLTFQTNRALSDDRHVTFGIREVGRELHRFGDQYGLRVLINGQKVFSQGGWLQPELLFEMPAKRMEAEVRYLSEANLNTVTFEDVPAPGDEFLDACDRYGLMYWTSFYSSYWVQPETNWPLDHQLLAQCGVDVIKRYWNHPSIVLYSCVGEGMPSKDIYLTWRKDVLALDRTRLFVPTLDVRQRVPWIEQDLPTGLHDAGTFWEISPPGYYQRVREGKKWMFNTEVSIATPPQVNNLNKFLPELLKDPGTGKEVFPVDATWAHHDASNYIKDLDPAIRLFYGPPRNVEDYCWKAQILSAERHRAWSEAVNHRMWDITSGVWQWKLNACWPCVGWQIYDWYLKPLANYYYYKSAFEPLHVQLSPLDDRVTIVNRRLQPATNLAVWARVYDSHMKLRWERRSTDGVAANAYHDVFAIPRLADLTAVYFVKLQLSREGRPVSENFYWLSSKPYAEAADAQADLHALVSAASALPRGGFSSLSSHDSADYSDLQRLPTVKLNTTHRIETRGKERIAHVHLENPTGQLAFFTHLAVTKGPQGEEVLPIYWDDNYFSLLPGESREIEATFAAEDLQGTSPVVEVGGWNVESPFGCTALRASKVQVQAGEPLTITATIRNTFLDGSRVDLYVDHEPVDWRLFWARGAKARELTFPLKLGQPGTHQIRVGNQTATVLVH